MSVLNFSYPIYTSSEYKFCTSFIKLFPNYFVLFDAAINRIFLNFFFRLFIASVQKYNCFFMLTLQPATWLNSFISSNRVLVDASECSVQNMMPSGNRRCLVQGGLQQAPENAAEWPEISGEKEGCEDLCQVLYRVLNVSEEKQVAVDSFGQKNDMITFAS